LDTSVVSNLLQHTLYFVIKLTKRTNIWLLT